MIVVDYYDTRYVFGGSWFDGSFLLHVGGHHFDSTPDSRCVPIFCPRLPCFLSGAGSTPDRHYNSRCIRSQYW